MNDNSNARNIPYLAVTGRIAAAASAATVLLAGAGCGWFGGGSTDAEQDRAAATRPTIATSTYESERAAPAALQPGNRPVAQGPLPLIYLVETDGRIRVSQVATGEEIASFDAKAGQIVRVESRGVLLQNRPVIGARLAAGTYAIEVLGPNAGMVVAEQRRDVPVVPPPQPPGTTRPTTAPTTQ